MFLVFDIFHILVLAAVLPALVILVKVYKEDCVEKEPFDLLVSLIVLGVSSTFLAMLSESWGSWILTRLGIENYTLYNFLMYFLVVALSEEGFKYILMKKRTWKHPAFNYLFDGVIYGVFISLGFALWENLIYILNYGLATAIARAVTAVPGHASFGVFMGLWYGLAKQADNHGYEELSRRYRFYAILFPVLIHGFYDFCLVQSGGISILFLIFIFCLFLLSWRTITAISRRDTRIRY